MAGLHIALLLILVLLDPSHSQQEESWELGRLQFAIKFCKNAEFQNLDHPSFEEGSVTFENVATTLAESGMVELSEELQKYTDDLLSLDKVTLEKLYKDINCALAGYNKMAEDVMAGGAVDICGPDVNYQDVNDAIVCIISICDHIQSFVDKMDDLDENCVTSEHCLDATILSWGITVSLITLESGLRGLKSDFSTPNEGTIRKYVEEYMAESCPGGMDLNSALKDKSENPINVHFEVVDQASLPGVLKDLKAELNEFLMKNEQDGVSDRLEKSWEKLLCTMVPFYALNYHSMEGGNPLCFDPEIDYDNGQDVANCLKQKIKQLESTLPDMINRKGYPYLDEFLATVEPVWNSLNDLQIGFAQLLRLADQG